MEQQLMQLQGSYFIQRDVFGKAHFLKVHNTLEYSGERRYNKSLTPIS